MSALSSKVKSAAQAQQMSEQLKSTVPALKGAMKQMEKAGINQSVSEFEKVFEDMEVKTQEIDQAMDNVYQTSIDTGEVNNLLQELADQNGMNIESQMDNQIGMGNIADPNANANPAQA